MYDSITIHDPDCEYCKGSGYAWCKVEVVNGEISIVPIRESEVKALTEIEFDKRFGPNPPLHCHWCGTYTIHSGIVVGMIAELRRLGVSDQIWKDNEAWKHDHA